MELFICKKFQNLIPPLQPCEYQQLEENILRDGCTTPLDVWPHDGRRIIVDGHNRHKICKEHGIPFEEHEVSFENEDDATIWIIKNQFGRRNLSNFHRAELVMVLEPLVAAKAKERQVAGLKQNQTVRHNWDERCEAEKGRADEELAKLANVSKNTIRRAKVIMEHGTPEQIKRARIGGQGNTVNAIYTEIKHRDMKEKTCPMCGKTLPMDRFYVERATCKTCTEAMKQEGLRSKREPPASEPVSEERGDPIKNLNQPAADAHTFDVLEKVAFDLYDTEREVERTVYVLLEDLKCISDDFLSKTKRSLQIYGISVHDDTERGLVFESLRETKENIERIMELVK